MAYSVIAAGGGLYVAGYTNATLPGQTSSGAYEAFVRRYDYAGVEQWTRQFGLSDPECVAYAVSAVEGGALYVAGYTGQTVPTLLTQAFVRKYDAAGTEQWTDVFGANGSVSALAVTTDENGDVVVAGQVGAALPGQVNAGECDDAFVRKYDAEGTELWTRQFGSIGCDAANAVTLDGAGSVYVAGHTGAGLPAQASFGKNDAFVRKYDSEGAELWTRQFGSDQNDYGNALAVDASGHVYVVGNTLGTLPNQPRLSDSDLFVRKYDAAGNEQWTRQTGTTRSDAANALAVGAQGNVYVTGNTTGTFPGQTRAGDYDAFALAWDGAGNELWSVQLGSNEADGVNGASVDESGSLYVAGFTRGALPEQVSAGVADAFVAKLAMPIW